MLASLAVPARPSMAPGGAGLVGEFFSPQANFQGKQVEGETSKGGPMIVQQEALKGCPSLQPRPSQIPGMLVAVVRIPGVHSDDPMGHCG